MVRNVYASGSNHLLSQPILSGVGTKEDLPQGVTDQELAASAEDQMETSIIGSRENREVDLNISESTSFAVVVDESNTTAQVPEMNRITCWSN